MVEVGAGSGVSFAHYPAAVSAAGFAIEELDRFTFRPTLLAIPVAPRVLGRARPAG